MFSSQKTERYYKNTLHEKPKIPHSLKYRIRTHKSTSKTTPQKKIKVAAVELPEMSIQILSSKKRRNNVKRQFYVSDLSQKKSVTKIHLYIFEKEM